MRGRFERLLGTSGFATYEPGADRAWSKDAQKGPDGKNITVTHPAYPYAVTKDRTIAVPRPREEEDEEEYVRGLGPFLPDGDGKAFEKALRAAYRPLGTVQADRKRRERDEEKKVVFAEMLRKKKEEDATDEAEMTEIVRMLDEGREEDYVRALRDMMRRDIEKQRLRYPGLPDVGLSATMNDLMRKMRLRDRPVPDPEIALALFRNAMWDTYSTEFSIKQLFLSFEPWITRLGPEKGGAFRRAVLEKYNPPPDPFVRPSDRDYTIRRVIERDLAGTAWDAKVSVPV